MLSTVILALAATVSAAVVERQAACSETHIFIAKGNNEPYPGRQGALVNAICDGLTSCSYEDILFYNPVEADYNAGTSEGITNGLAQMYAYNARCPDAELVLSGYSQGAQIVVTMLAGYESIQGIDPNSSTGKKIAAALVFGNPLHSANAPYNVLSGVSGNGYAPLAGAQLAALSQYTSVFHDYCAAADPLCAGGDVIADHLNYFDLYTNTAADWVKSMLVAAASKPTTSAGSTSATITPVTSSTAAPFPTVKPAGNGTSTIYATQVYTITSCAASVTNCPARTQTTSWVVPSSTAYTQVPIPTATTTLFVTVPCETANTASLSSFMSTYSETATIPAPVITGTGYSIPTSSVVKNGTYSTAAPAPTSITANSGSMTGPSVVVGLAAAAFFALLL